MSKKVAFVELTVFSGVLPLASGYMEAYCRKDPELAAQLSFEKISMPVSTTPYETVLEALRKADADIYAFSCYVWNIGMVRRLLAVLLAEKPGAHFILGGPQVINQAHRYLTPEHENVFICNGEGERTFYHFMKALLSPERDMRGVRNIGTEPAYILAILGGTDPGRATWSKQINAQLRALGMQIDDEGNMVKAS